MPDINAKKPSPIAYSCYYERNREGEQFVSEHVFSFQISGTLSINDGKSGYRFEAGDFRFIRKNQLLKFVKQPPEGGVFKSISIYLDQQTLQDFSTEFHQKPTGKSDEIPTVLHLNERPLFKSFMDSLLSYIQTEEPINEQLAILKQREAIMILLQANPELKTVLFDFSMPGKVDLEAFMHKNFHFNVQMNRFAFLTGRSLATFKRDFERVFGTSPGKWLQLRRLQEAHYLIKEKGMMPSDVYLETGFENLSHFSFAFRKLFGMPPSKIG